jgi:hypothetical protein
LLPGAAATGNSAQPRRNRDNIPWVENAVHTDMKSLPTLIAALAVGVLAALGQSPEAAAQDQQKCEELYGSWYQYLERERCLREWRRKEKLRICISQDFGRMESLARKIRDGIQPTMFLSDAKELMEKLLEKKLDVRPAKGEPRGTMVETIITSNCATPFQLIVQVRALETQELLHVRFWSRFAPAGYHEGLRTDLSRDFEESQRLEAAEKRRRDGKAADGGGRDGGQDAMAKKREPGSRPLQEQAGRLSRPPAAPARRGSRSGEAGTQPWALAAPPPKNDHCAPDLARNERIWRLQRFGLVRQTGPDTYRAKGHSLTFKPKTESLQACD